MQVAPKPPFSQRLGEDPTKPERLRASERERESEQNLFRLLQLFLARNNIKLGFYLTWALG